MKIISALLFLAINTSIAIAQLPGNSKVDIAGTYTLVTVDNILADGTRVHLYGDKPQGLLIFDKLGNYSLQIMSLERPKFALGDKAKGTDEENREAIKGCNTHFGTFNIDADKQIITFNISHALFPNWEGISQKRPFTLSKGLFKYSVPSPTTGGTVTGEVVWKKLD